MELLFNGRKELKEYLEQIKKEEINIYSSEGLFYLLKQLYKNQSTEITNLNKITEKIIEQFYINKKNRPQIDDFNILIRKILDLLELLVNNEIIKSPPIDPEEEEDFYSRYLFRLFSKNGIKIYEIISELRGGIKKDPDELIEFLMLVNKLKSKKDAILLLKLLILFKVVVIKNRKIVLNNKLSQIADTISKPPSWFCWSTDLANKIFTIEEAEKNDDLFLKLHYKMIVAEQPKPKARIRKKWSEKEIIDFLKKVETMDKPRVIAIVGSQGSGKSELIRYISLKLPKVSLVHTRELTLYIRRRHMNPISLVEELLTFLEKINPIKAKEMRKRNIVHVNYDIRKFDHTKAMKIFFEGLELMKGDTKYKNVKKFIEKMNKNHEKLAKGNLYSIKIYPSLKHYYQDFLINAELETEPEIISRKVFQEILSKIGLKENEDSEDFNILYSSFTQSLKEAMEKDLTSVSPTTILEEIEKEIVKKNKRLLVLFEDLTVAGSKSYDLLNWFTGLGSLKNIDIIMGYTRSFEKERDFERVGIQEKENIFDRFTFRFLTSEETSEFPDFLKKPEDQIGFVRKYLEVLKEDHNADCICKRSPDEGLYPLNEQFILNLFELIDLKTPREVLKNLHSILTSYSLPSDTASNMLGEPLLLTPLDTLPEELNNKKNEIKHVFAWYGKYKENKIIIERFYSEVFDLNLNKLPLTNVNNKEIDTEFFEVSEKVTRNFETIEDTKTREENPFEVELKNELNKAKANLNDFINRSGQINLKTENYIIYGISYLISYLNLFPLSLLHINAENSTILWHYKTNILAAKIRIGQRKEKYNAKYPQVDLSKKHLKNEEIGERLLNLGFWYYKLKNPDKKLDAESQEIIRKKFEDTLKKILNNSTYHTEVIYICKNVIYDSLKEKLRNEFRNKIMLNSQEGSNRPISLLIKHILALRILVILLLKPDISIIELKHKIKDFNEEDLEVEAKKYSKILIDEQEICCSQEYLENQYIVVMKVLDSYLSINNKLLTYYFSSMINFENENDFWETIKELLNSFLNHKIIPSEKFIFITDEERYNKSKRTEILNFLENLYFVEKPVLSKNKSTILYYRQITEKKHLSVKTVLENIFRLKIKLIEKGNQKISDIELLVPKSETEFEDLIANLRDIIEDSNLLKATRRKHDELKEYYSTLKEILSNNKGEFSLLLKLLTDNNIILNELEKSSCLKTYLLRENKLIDTLFKLNTIFDEALEETKDCEITNTSIDEEVSNLLEEVTNKIDQLIDNLRQLVE